MDKNAISQTLFRFVSLRNPELSNEDGQDKRFIFSATQNEKNYFQTTLNNKESSATKWQTLQGAANSFNGFTTENEVKQLNTKLYNFGTWLSRNKSTTLNAELMAKINGVGTLDAQKLETLWDNLIYQVVTQKSFYIKEAIMQMLLANHVVLHADWDEGSNAIETNTLLMNATVVLPKALFVEDATNQTIAEPLTPIEPTPSEPNAFMQKQQTIALAKNEIAALTQLKTALGNAEKEYQKEYNNALDAYNLNLNIVENTAEESQEQINTTALKIWLLKNPDLKYDGKTLPQGFTYPEPLAPIKANVEPFSFKPALNAENLESKLNQDDKVTFCTLTGATYNKENNGFNFSTCNVATFLEVNHLIHNAISNNNDALIANTVTGNRVISVGGMLLPQNDSPYRKAFEFQLCPKVLNNGNINFDVSFEVPGDDFDVASILCHINFANGIGSTSGYFNKTQIGNVLLLSNLFNQGVDNNAAAIINLTGEIVFTNGVRKSFTISNFNVDQCFTGQLLNSDGTIDETYYLEENENSFVPSGFGFKQIGIADYKKVEQTVHCYVEGEVAHIENIMAREYKEKSTRRLRRSENTTTKSSESEKEQLTDNNSTSRYDMQNEVSKVLQENKDFSANANLSGTKLGITLGVGANYATHNSKEESTRQAVTQAKEITEKALDRLVSKVREERIEKIVEEFEENNKHGFDNTKGDKHVIGVFRWIDKVFKNLIYNFGKRLMFEFMVPQPAKLHTLGMKADIALTTLTKPEDPRTATSFGITDYSQINETTAKYWSGKLNAEIKPMPDMFITIGESFDYFSKDGPSGISKSGSINIPENYATTRASVNFHGMIAGSNWASLVIVGVGNKSFQSQPLRIDEKQYVPIDNYSNKIPITFSVTSYHTANASIAVECKLTDAAYQKWQQDTFNEIINAFYVEMADYNEKVAEEQAKASAIKSDNPNFYRQIEQTILRKNCIAYLLSQNENSSKTYGKLMHNDANSFANYNVNTNRNLDNYTALAKFMEQAFEWEIMSYNLYPFYWAAKKDWLKLYQTDNADPLFRSFMQSGLARVVVTVRPGFEAAVQHYISTGQIWNGGQIPVIGDPLYLSLVDEMKEPTGKPEGKAWVTRVPTALTILQAESIGLVVEKALPCNCDDIADFEDPTTVPCGDGFVLTNAKMKASGTDMENLRLVENLDINNGKLQLADDGNPRQVIAEISLEAIKRGMGL